MRFESLYFRDEKALRGAFIFENANNIDNRMDTAINYLGTEGFFKQKKRIKATAVHISEGYPSDEVQ